MTEANLSSPLAAKVTLWNALPVRHHELNILDGAELL